MSSSSGTDPLDYRVEYYTRSDLFSDALLGASGLTFDYAASKEGVKAFATAMSRSGAFVLTPVALALELPGYIEAYNSISPREAIAIEAAGTVGRVVGGTAGYVAGGAAFGIPSVALGAAGQWALGQILENGMRALIEWSHIDGPYPDYPWTPAGNSPYGLPDRFDPNPYQKMDPALGVAVRSGYTGLNTGYDTPSELNARNRGAKAPSFREAELASMDALKDLQNGMTGGKLPGKDKDDRDLARAPSVSGISPNGRISESTQAERTRRENGMTGGRLPGKDKDDYDISGPSRTSKDSRATDRSGSLGGRGDRDTSRDRTPSDRSPSDQHGGGGGRERATQGGNGGRSPNSSGSPDDRQDRNNSKSTTSKSTRDPTKDHRGGGRMTAPVLLDLTGNGISVDTISTSSQFVDIAGDGYQHRTAWAGKGTGVLVIDADGDGKISRSSEFVFTEWDPTATGDLAAIKSVFDTNGNGKLDAGDARWNDFKVMVDGQLVTLASLGIISIDLTPTGSGQRFDDGSAVTGTTTYTKSDGSTGTVGDAVLVSDANGYVIKRTTTNNADASTTVAIDGYDKEGQIAFRNSILTSADGLTKTTKFDDDGNGTWDRSQVETLRQAAPFQADPPPQAPTPPYTPPVGPNDIAGTAGTDYLSGQRRHPGWRFSQCRRWRGSARHCWPVGVPGPHHAGPVVNPCRRPGCGTHARHVSHRRDQDWKPSSTAVSARSLDGGQR
ncbi:hypothetical protein [Aminobacter carboxidus]|uniref:Uncharacterized protein n=1 Tax=Aminobacter carboxidus TaxID=376165 RepID=A0ABR9GXQ9_9HYPH|nr:hypothetical protein [Aminobacter carboxidus]MBE1208475.1 hypothetical protein [Aminobacter carboxidus]